MVEPQIDDVVRLKQDFPDLFLFRGSVGVVRSVWFEPWAAYEVEFEISAHGCQTRALLFQQHIEVEQSPES